jgi:hypothetical protein
MGVYLKITVAGMITVPVLHALALVLNLPILSEFATVLTTIVGLLAFLFDCVMIYTFSKYFFSKEISVKKNIKYGYIAKYGMVSTACVLLGSLCFIAANPLDQSSRSLSRTFLVILFLFLQMSGWVFIALKRALKEEVGSEEPQPALKGVVSSVADPSSMV